MATNAAVQALYGAGMRDPTQFWSNLSGFIFGVFYTTLRRTPNVGRCATTTRWGEP